MAAQAYRQRALKAAFESVLPVRLPYDWQALMDFLAQRAIDGVERVDDQGYTRTLCQTHSSGRHAGWVRLRPDLESACLRVTLSPSLEGVAPAVMERLGFLTDADCDPAQVSRALGALAQHHPGLRVPGAVDGFELAVRAILGQQITVRAARTLAGRFAATFGSAIDAPGLGVVFPRAVDVARLQVSDIAVLGVIATRAQAIIDIAGALHQGDLVLAPGANPERCIAALTAIRGVGEWTAHYVAMRALGWRDAFPHADLALRKAMGGVTAREARQLSEAWRPWRAYAAAHLWRSLQQKASPSSLRR